MLLSSLTAETQLTLLRRADEYMLDIKVPLATTAARQTAATKGEIDVLTSQDLHARIVRSRLQIRLRLF